MKRNIYILFPAGYNGTYLSWAISKSITSLSHSITNDPLNLENSPQFGGSGTAHGHIRVPTHQGDIQTLIWIASCKPIEKKIYLINIDGTSLSTNKKGHQESAAELFLRYDPDGVIINIHDNNNKFIESFGTINCVTKWPTYMEIEFQRRNITQFDSFNCNTIEFRNFAVTSSDFFHRARCIEKTHLKDALQTQINWYNTRKSLQPHEVNSETYPYLEKLSKLDIESKIYELTCIDIIKPSFIKELNDFLVNYDISYAYNTSYVESYHNKFITTQNNTQWFESISKWIRTGIIDEYLTSHAIIEAQLLKMMLPSIDNSLDWQNLSTRKINEIYHEKRNT